MSKVWATESTHPVHDTVKPMILIVDDHTKMRVALLEWLSATFPDCRLQEARSGEEALAVAVAQAADVVLINIHLPHMSGIEATWRMKTISPRTQTVIMSFYEDQSYRVAAERAGASAFVPIRTLSSDLIPIVTSLLASVAAKAKD